MAQDPESEALKTRVHPERLGPLSDVLDSILEAGFSPVRQGLANLRQLASGDPFVPIYVALQAGYFVGKLAQRHAQR